MIVIIVCFLALISLLPFWDFSLIKENYISFIPFVLYTIVLFLFERLRKKNITNNSVVKTNCWAADIYKAFFLNFLFFALFIFVFYLTIKFSMSFFSKNILLFIFYVWFTQNSAVTSPGFCICKIFIDRFTIRKAISLLLYNFYKYSIFYLALFQKRFFESKSGTNIFCILFILTISNFQCLFIYIIIKFII